MWVILAGDHSDLLPVVRFVSGLHALSLQEDFLS